MSSPHTQSPRLTRPRMSTSTSSSFNAPPSPMSRRTSLMAVSSNNAATQSSDEPAVPVRHPRPLTAAELHLELEKEQEAVVNRLQRELSALRAQTASAASNASASSASSNTSAIFDPATDAAHSITTPSSSIYPTSSRRHRSSSSLSISHGTSQASVDRARDAGMAMGVGMGSRSRQNSHSMSLSMSGNAQLSSSVGSVSMPAPPRASLSRQTSERMGQSPYFGGASGTGGGGGGQGQAAGQAVQSPGVSRWEEVKEAKALLEGARKENERLAARVRELEGLLRVRRTGAGGGEGDQT